MEECKYIHLTTSKLFVDKVYHGIPSFKQVKRTRLFSKDEYQRDGLQLYRQFSNYFGDNIVPIDRTNTILTPFKTTLHEQLSLPEFKSSNSFSDCCDERATAILTSAKYINVMYGGGIDSAAMLVALIKNSSEKQRQAITVFMDSDSIARNKPLYENLICGKLKVRPSYDFVDVLGKNDSIFVSGDCGDNIFGSSYIQNLMYRSSYDVMTEEPTLSNVLSILNRNAIIETDEERRDHRTIIEMLFAVADKSPVELDTVYKLFWWLNFCLSWNVSYMRYASFSQNSIALETNYMPFFSTKEFQLWSMNNVDRLSIDKVDAKDYINEYHEFYASPSQVKTNNVSKICYNKPCVFSIDSSMRFRYDAHDVFQKENSFV